MFMKSLSPYPTQLFSIIIRVQNHNWVASWKKELKWKIRSGKMVFIARVKWRRFSRSYFLSKLLPASHSITIENITISWQEDQWCKGFIIVNEPDNRGCVQLGANHLGALSIRRGTELLIIILLVYALHCDDFFFTISSCFKSRPSYKHNLLIHFMDSMKNI
jgi:hypothetical protein